jgi:hypothetical protein
MTKLVDIGEQQVVICPKEKRVESVHYTDGTVDMFLNIPTGILGQIYQAASAMGVSPEEFIQVALETELGKLEEDLSEEQP